MKMVGTSVLTPETTARLFGIELPKAEAVVATERPLTPEELAAQAPVKTSLRASLIGTMVANRPQWSFATLRDDGSHDVGVYMVGDKFLNAEILEIDRLRVVLLNENRKEYLALHDDTEAPPPPAPVASAPSTPSTPPADGEGVNKIDENNYEIARSKIDEQLSNLNNIATQARIVPSFKDGVANGFKLFSIRPGSLYSQIGIQNGDVIRRINGYEINSPDKALEVYSKLKESSKIEIELERRGTPLKKTYSIR
jgi:general secretion pathway protein C